MEENDIRTGAVEAEHLNGYAVTAERLATGAVRKAPTGGDNPAQQSENPTDMMRQMQAEIDRRVTQALEKQRKEYEKKLSLTGLDEQQRALAERDQQIEALQEQLKTAQAERNRFELSRTLAERGLPVTFADLIAATDDPDVMLGRVNTLDAEFKAAVEAGVKARISGKAAPGKAGAPAPAMTREQFGKLSLAQMQKLRAEDPETYKSMTEKH